jgi:F-type H+-transporting ATPase subunit a
LALEGEFHTPNLGHEFFPGGDKSPTDGNIVGREGLWLNDFAGGLFAVDRLMLIRLLMIVILALFFYVAMRRPKLIPRGVQNVAEIGLDFVRVNVAEEILGKKEGRRFLPVITTIFFVVLIGNLPSVIPFLNVSPNARIGMPIILAAVAYIAMIYAGVKRYGFGKFMKSSLVIPNLPPALHILVVPIEFFSTFILRPVTLTIRLMANMLAGHIILVLLFSATNFFFWQMNGWTVLSAGTLAFGLAFMLFEMLIIFLQAYIFSLLAAVYIELSLHADEH